MDFDRLREFRHPKTHLAADRTIFAAERTYAAWVRTGLAALASGVGAARFLQGTIPHWGLLAVGSVLILYSAFCFVAAVWREVRSGPRGADVPRLPVLLLAAVNALLVAVAGIALAGIWMGGAG
jgi:putative membrane protein